jgi:thioredoxin 1
LRLLTSGNARRKPSGYNPNFDPEGMETDIASVQPRSIILSDLTNVDQNNFQQEVLQAAGPVLVDFWAPWCGPCRMVAPVVDKVAQAYQGRLKVVKLNTDESPSIAGKYEVSGIPALILFKSGEPVDRIVGYVPEKQLASMVEKHLSAVA